MRSRTRSRSRSRSRTRSRSRSRSVSLQQQQQQQAKGRKGSNSNETDAAQLLQDEDDDNMDEDTDNYWQTREVLLTLGRLRASLIPALLRLLLPDLMDILQDPSYPRIPLRLTLLLVAHLAEGQPAALSEYFPTLVPALLHLLPSSSAYSSSLVGVGLSVSVSVSVSGQTSDKLPDTSTVRLVFQCLLSLLAHCRVCDVSVLLSVRQALVGAAESLPVDTLLVFDTLVRKITLGQTLTYTDIPCLERPWEAAVLVAGSSSRRRRTTQGTESSSTTSLLEEGDERERGAALGPLRLTNSSSCPTSPTKRSTASSTTTSMKQQLLTTTSSSVASFSTTLTINLPALEAAWEPPSALTSTITHSHSQTYTNTHEAWHDWLRRVSLELLRQSPSPLLRPCAPLAHTHSLLASSLFNVAFFSLWTALCPFYPYGDDGSIDKYPLIDALEAVLRSPSLPPSILNKLLALCEFMELREKPLPIDMRLLGRQAERAQAFAKCLKYKEREFHADPSPACMEALISVYHQLGLREAAVGILRHSESMLLGGGAGRGRAGSGGGGSAGGGDGGDQKKGKGGGGGKRPALTGAIAAAAALKPSWLEKIQQWEKALTLYDGYVETQTQTVQAKAPAPASATSTAATATETALLERQRRASSAASASSTGSGSSSSTTIPAADVAPPPPSLATSTNTTTPTDTPTDQQQQQQLLLEAQVGKLRCLEALGDYPSLLQAATHLKHSLQSNTHTLTPTPLLGAPPPAATATAAAPAAAGGGGAGEEEEAKRQWRECVAQTLLLGTKAAFNLGQWEEMEGFLQARAQMLGLVSSSAASAASASSCLSSSSLTHLDENGQPQQQGADDEQEQQETATTAASPSSSFPSFSDEDPLFYQAILHVAKHNFPAADACIAAMRNKLAPVLSSLLKESYTRAYRGLVTAQQLVELEEVMDCKRRLASLSHTHRHNPQHHNEEQDREKTLLLGNLKAKWDARLRHAAPDIKVLRRLLSLRPLLFHPQEDVGAWLRLAATCRRQGQLTLCGNVLKGMGAKIEVLALDGGGLGAGGGGGGGSGEGSGGKHLGAVVEEEADPHVGLSLSSSAKTLRSRSPTHSSSHCHSHARFISFASTSGGGGGGGNDCPPDSTPPRVRYCVAKLLWASEQQPQALRLLRELESELTLSTATFVSQHNLALFSNQGRVRAAGKVVTMKCQHDIVSPMFLDEEQEGMTRETLLARVLVRIGEWSLHCHEVGRGGGGGSGGGDPLSYTICSSSSSSGNGKGGAAGGSVMEEVLSHLRRATELCPSSYKAWHAWGKTNHSMAEKMLQRSTASGAAQTHKDGEDDKKAPAFIVQAVRGYIRAISYGAANETSTSTTTNSNAYVLQDTLRLLTLFFAHGKRLEVAKEMELGLGTIPVGTWLEVIPQLIARIDAPSHTISTLLQNLLVKVGNEHAQALIYPITVAATHSTGVRRRAAAMAILAELRLHSPGLVEEAEMVSRELINAAMTRQELWQEGLEEAAKLYYGSVASPAGGDGGGGPSQGVTAAVAVLETLHVNLGGTGLPSPAAAAAAVGRVPATGCDDDGGDDVHDDDNGGIEIRSVLAFSHSYERELSRAYGWLCRYKQSGLEADMCQAWEIYSSVHRGLSKYVTGIKKLDLRHVAPRLLTKHARDLRLAVPGTYRQHQSVVRIHSFSPQMVVQTSKQRPRRLTMLGSDGRPYTFLLKGHEDLRQDERVMQLFGLINALLRNNPSTARSNLNITRYSVMPLAANSGLIGWVKNCDTLHQLVKDYRESRRVRLQLEHRLLAEQTPAYDKLPHMQKVEVFKEVLLQTRGMELAKMLWLKSSNSEIWLERRNNYTRSLAVMSMAGYILGLGDRHPSNLMIDRVSGRVVHIDFGDCFEVAMNRTKFPETVPFRLTRMLINAMEGGGVEGSFRITCENVMEVLRGNRESLLAMLEAFVHDPLISWKLFATAAPTITTAAATTLTSTASATAAAGGGGGGATNKSDGNLSAVATTALAASSGVGAVAVGEGEQEVGEASKPVQPVLLSSTTTTATTTAAAVAELANNKSSTVLMMMALASAQTEAATAAAAAAAAATTAGGEGEGGGSGSGKVTSPSSSPSSSAKEKKGGQDEGGGAGRIQAEEEQEQAQAQEQRKEQEEEEEIDATQELNQCAVAVMQRIQQKLLGRDFLLPSSPSSPPSAEEEELASSSSLSSSSKALAAASLPPQEQVDRLIKQATSVENLCQLFLGWSPFW